MGIDQNKWIKVDDELPCAPWLFMGSGVEFVSDGLMIRLKDGNIFCGNFFEERWSKIFPGARRDVSYFEDFNGHSYDIEKVDSWKYIRTWGGL